MVFGGQHVHSNGARTYSPSNSNNVFAKIVIPVGAPTRLMLLGTYKENDFNQPDNDGVRLAKVEKAVLTGADLDPAFVLPPPPARESPQSWPSCTQRSRERRTTRPRRWDGGTKGATIFAGATGPGVDLDRLPATTRPMALVRASEKEVANRSKAEFRRERLDTVDPLLKSCKRNDDPLSSYPGGHTGRDHAYQQDARAPAARARSRHLRARGPPWADAYHLRAAFPQRRDRDAVLGALVAERLRGKPAFDDAYRAAAAELAAAGVR